MLWLDHAVISTLGLSVHVFSVTDSLYLDEAGLSEKFVDDAIIADADTISVV